MDLIFIVARFVRWVERKPLLQSCAAVGGFLLFLFSPSRSSLDTCSETFV